MLSKTTPAAAPFNVALKQYATPNQRQAAVLTLWREHPDKAVLWCALQDAASKHGVAVPEPVDFIGVVLGSTMSARRLNDHDDQVLQQFEKLKWKIGAVVKDSTYPMDLWRDLAQFEEPLRELGRSAYDVHKPAGGRKNQNGSRDHKLFVLRMFRYLQEACGRPLISEVVKMLSIVFPDGDHDERTVRSWLPKLPKHHI